MNKILGLRTCIYRVNELEKATAWYSKAFNTSPYFNEAFYVGFNIGGYELGLQPDESRKGDSVLTYWGVADIRKSFDHFLELGATVHEEPQNVGGPIEVASVYDPWGNIIGLIFNPEFRLPG